MSHFATFPSLLIFTLAPIYANHVPDVSARVYKQVKKIRTLYSDTVREVSDHPSLRKKPCREGEHETYDERIQRVLRSSYDQAAEAIDELVELLEKAILELRKLSPRVKTPS